MEWLAFSYFGEDLPVRAAALEGAPFIPLGAMIKAWDALERGRPLGPPGFVGAPPVGPGLAAAPAPAMQPAAPDLAAAAQVRRLSRLSPATAAYRA